MTNVPPFGVRIQQRANQQHGRPGGADKAGQQPADGDKHGIRQSMSTQVALDTNPAADRIEAKEQYDKGNEFMQDRVGEDCPAKSPLRRRAAIDIDHMMGRPMSYDRVCERRISKCVIQQCRHA